MRIGVFGGTFNPIHTGHLILAEAAREQLRLDRVLFIPTHQPPHKHVHDLLPGSVRLKLIRLAIKDHPAFAVSNLELRRGGVSYTVETIRELRQRFSTAQWFLLMGQDMLRARWFAWSELKRLCTIVVAARSNTPTSRREAGLVRLTMPQIEIASSDIRLRLCDGRSIRYLVPPAVERYLRRHHLYQRMG